MRRVHAPPRVVLDTNVVLSALLFRDGVASQMRLAWRDGECQPLIATATVQELLRVLAYPKFRLNADDQHELLADYLPYATTIRIPNPPPAVPTCRDAFDTRFLELAVAGKAAALVTGDQDLLVLAGQTRFAILAPAAFLAGL